MTTRKVKLKVTFDVYYDVPEEWTDEQVRFYFTGSTFCTNNLLEEKLERDVTCSCFPYDVELLEGTPEEAADRLM